MSVGPGTMNVLRIVLPILILALVAVSSTPAHADPATPDSAGFAWTDDPRGTIDWAILNASSLTPAKRAAANKGAAWVANIAGPPALVDTSLICDVSYNNPPPGLSPQEIDLVMRYFRLQSDLTTSFGVYDTALTQFEHQARLWYLGCETLPERALVLCVQALYRTPGVIEASPRFGIVNVPSLFWISGMLAQQFNSWRFDASMQTVSEWDPRTPPPATDGVYLKMNTNFSYTYHAHQYDIPCNALGGFVDPNHPFGHYWGGPGHVGLVPTRNAYSDFKAQRKQSNSAGPNPPWSDTNNDGSYNDQTLSNGVVRIQRRLLPDTMTELDLTVEFGPWYWYFSGKTQPDTALTFDDGGPGATPPSSVEDCDGSTLRSNDPRRACAPFELMIADDSSIRRQPNTISQGDSATPSQIQGALDRYDGPTFTYDQHGAYPVQVIVGKTLASAPFRVRVRDEYEWEERWRIDELRPAQYTTWSDARPANCPWRPGRDCLEDAQTRKKAEADAWTAHQTHWYIKDSYDVPAVCNPPVVGEECSTTVYIWDSYTHNVGECDPQIYTQYDNVKDSNCSYDDLDNEYRHKYYAYWTCKGNRASQLRFDWYEPGGITSDGTNRPSQPTGECVVVHALGYDPPNKATFILSQRPLDGLRRIYDFDDPPAYGQTPVDDAYPVRRRFPVLVDER